MLNSNLWWTPRGPSTGRMRRSSVSSGRLSEEPASTTFRCSAGPCGAIALKSFTANGWTGCQVRSGS